MDGKSKFETLFDNKVCDTTAYKAHFMRLSQSNFRHYGTKLFRWCQTIESVRFILVGVHSVRKHVQIHCFTIIIHESASKFTKIAFLNAIFSACIRVKINVSRKEKSRWKCCIKFIFSAIFTFEHKKLHHFPKLLKLLIFLSRSLSCLCVVKLLSWMSKILYIKNGNGSQMENNVAKYFSIFAFASGIIRLW